MGKGSGVHNHFPSAVSYRSYPIHHRISFKAIGFLPQMRFLHPTVG